MTQSLESLQPTKEVQIGPFMSLLTDVGFTRVFGREKSKPFLIRFLNLLLFAKTDEKIESIDFLKSKSLKDYVEDEKVIFDLKCTTNKNEIIIVEMQKLSEHFFKERSLFYGCISVLSQAPEGLWNFDLKKVHVVSLLNFELEGSKKMISNLAMLSEKNTRIDMDFLELTFVELPKLNKTLEECDTELEKLFYLVSHLGELKDIPESLKNLENWNEFFELARIPRKGTIDYKKYLSEYEMLV